jgi:ribosome-associated protein
MDGDLEIRPGVVIPEGELRWRFSKASGPGGQGVNTTDSRVQVTFDLAQSPSVPDVLKARAIRRLGPRVHEGSITITAMESRSQWQNRRSARIRLMEVLRQAMASPPRQRRATRPTRGSVERRISEKKARGQVKRLRQAREGD